MIEFVDYDMSKTNEMIKQKFKSKDKKKSIYLLKAICRCYHDTRYEETRQVKTVLEKNPLKRFRNTNCPFQMTFKILKENKDYPCNVFMEYNHNHLISSLEALSFRMPSAAIKLETDALSFLSDSLSCV